jgi:hypothetical protein
VSKTVHPNGGSVLGTSLLRSTLLEKNKKKKKTGNIDLD